MSSYRQIVSALLMYRQKKNDGKPRRCIPALLFVIGSIYFGLAVDALLIKPTGLVVREMTLQTPKITEPVTIVFCADMQTDCVVDALRHYITTKKLPNLPKKLQTAE